MTGTSIALAIYAGVCLGLGICILQDWLYQRRLIRQRADLYRRFFALSRQEFIARGHMFTPDTIIRFNVSGDEEAVRALIATSTVGEVAQ